LSDLERDAFPDYTEASSRVYSPNLIVDDIERSAWGKNTLLAHPDPVREFVSGRKPSMPVLQAEPDVWPSDLFDPEMTVEKGERCWQVMHTRSRQEKALARQLGAGRIPFYLPLITRRSRSGGRAIVSHVPLFPGYVFVLASREERWSVLSTRRVVRPLEVVDQAGLWRDLRQVQRLIASGEPLVSEPRWQPGVRVKICGGPLAGLVGQVLRTASGRRFVVQVDFIQRGASILLDDSVLERVASP
jgi:transcription antitermination factor NusG